MLRTTAYTNSSSKMPTVPQMIRVFVSQKRRGSAVAAAAADAGTGDEDG